MRRNLSARLSIEAHEGWGLLALDLGASVAAILEAIGLWAVDHGGKSPASVADIAAIGDRARAIDRARHSRAHLDGGTAVT